MFEWRGELHEGENGAIVETHFFRILFNFKTELACPSSAERVLYLRNAGENVIDGGLVLVDCVTCEDVGVKL